MSPVRVRITFALNRAAEFWFQISAWAAMMVLLAHVAPAEAQNRGDEPFRGTRDEASIRVTTRDSSVVLVAVGSADSLVVAADPAGVRLWADNIHRVLSQANERSGSGSSVCEGYVGACALKATLATFGYEPFDVYVESDWIRSGYRFGVTVIRKYPVDDTLFSEMGAADVERFTFTLRRAAAEADSMRAEPLAGAFESDSVDKIPVLTAESRELLELHATQMWRDGGVVEIVVTPEGTVESASIRLVGFYYSGGYEEPLKSDVEQLRFTPGERKGKPVRVRMRIPLGYLPYSSFIGLTDRLNSGVGLPEARHSNSLTLG